MSSMFSSTQKQSSEASLNRVAENLYRMPSSGRYYAQARVQGKLLRQSLKTCDRKLAERRLSLFLKKVGRIQPGSGKVTFGDVYTRWLTIEQASKDKKESSKKADGWTYKALLKNWWGLDSLEVRSITEEDCQKWLAKRRATASAATVRREIQLLRALLAYACKQGIILDNPAAALEQPRGVKRKPRIPNRKEFLAIVEELRRSGNLEAAHFVELLGYSGMRRNEAAFLTWGDIDNSLGQITIRGEEGGPKNSEERVIPMFPSLPPLLERIKADHVGASAGDRVMLIKECRGAIEGACKRLSLPHFSHHDFRHFFASNAVEKGIDFKVIADWLGHKDGGLLVARTYSHLRAEHSKAMAERMVFEA
jgi:integrase